MSIFLAGYFEHRTESLDGDSVAHHDEPLAHEDVGVLLVADEGHRADGHQGVGEGIVHHQVLYVLGCLAGLDLPLVLHEHSLKKYLAADLFGIPSCLPERLNCEDQLADVSLIHIVQGRLDEIPVEGG